MSTARDNGDKHIADPYADQTQVYKWYVHWYSQRLVCCDQGAGIEALQSNHSTHVGPKASIKIPVHAIILNSNSPLNSIPLHVHPDLVNTIPHKFAHFDMTGKDACSSFVPGPCTVFGCTKERDVLQATKSWAGPGNEARLRV